MTEHPNRRETSEAVTRLGWRLVLDELSTSVAVSSLAQAAAVAVHIVARCGEGVDASLQIDLRPDRLNLRLRAAADYAVTRPELDLAATVSAAVSDIGLVTSPEIVGARARSVQAFEIAIDAIDIPAIRPFWQAVTGYVDQPGWVSPNAGLVDPFGQSPAIWFQQMDEPRRQRNRIHFDISVPHDEAQARIEATVAAGGVLVSDSAAPAFWIMADAEGNEACICTWQGRDPE